MLKSTIGGLRNIIDTSLLHVIAISEWEWVDGVVKYFHYKEITCQHKALMVVKMVSFIYCPQGLCFDSKVSLYVVDNENC